MRTYFDDVGEFHRKFGIPLYDPRMACEFPTLATLEYRLKFMDEELREFRESIIENDLEKALDSLIDLAYVAFGTAHYFNAPLNPMWQEVQRANMAKVLVTRENCPPEKQYRADEGLVMKPPGWLPPQHAEILRSHNAFARRMIGRMR